MNKWRIDYDNDTGPFDEGYWEWWTVTNDKRSFKCDNEDHAKWLFDILSNDWTQGEQNERIL